MKTLKILALIAIALVVAVPAGISAQGPAEVTLWYHSGRPGERDELSDLTDAFNASQSEYVVTRTEIPEGSYADNVKAAALAGDLPCVLDFDGPFVYNYVFSGDLIPLDGYISDELKSDILPSIIEQGTVNGQLWSIGSIESGLAIWGNKAMLEEAGVRIPTGIEDAWTLDEFNAAIEALAAVVPEGGYVIDFKMNYCGAGAGCEWASYGFAPIIQSFGGDVIDRETMATAEGFLNGPEAYEAMTWFGSLFANGYSTATPVDADADFMEGRVPLSWVGHWMYNPYKEALGDNLVLIPMPKFGEKAVTGMGSWNWGITSTCAVPDGAWAFIDFLMIPENHLSYAAGAGALPSRMSVLAADERFAEGGDMYIYFQQLAQGVAVPRPATPAYPAIQIAMTDIILGVARGEDVQALLDSGVDTIDGAIAELE